MFYLEICRLLAGFSVRNNRKKKKKKAILCLSAKPASWLEKYLCTSQERRDEGQEVNSTYRDIYSATDL